MQREKDTSIRPAPACWDLEECCVVFSTWPATKSGLPKWQLIFKLILLKFKFNLNILSITVRRKPATFLLVDLFFDILDQIESVPRATFTPP